MRIVNIIGIAVAWSAVIAWFVPSLTPSFGLLVSPIILGGAMAALPREYELTISRFIGWLIVLTVAVALVAAEALPKQFVPIAMLLSFPILITGIALAGLLNRENSNHNE
jgi:hypothetical protein